MKLKASLEEENKEMEDIKKQMEILQQELVHKQNLVSQLEEDLSKQYLHRSEQRIPELNLPASSSSSPSSSSDSYFSMIEIFSSQRDRFKTRVAELEKQNEKLQRLLKEKTDESDAVKDDNVQLYQKIRYLQSYNQYKNISSNMEKGQASDLELKYKKLYEESVNPFLVFNKKEKYERYKELNTAEKFTFTTFRWCLANKYLRTFLFFYAIALHLLVFLTLYRFANATTS